MDNLLIYLRGSADCPELVIGEGDHTCKVYKLTPQMLRNLAVDSVKLFAAGMAHTVTSAGTTPPTTCGSAGSS